MPQAIALEELLGKVAPLITHQDTIMCQAIPPGAVRAAAISLFAFVCASLFLYSVKVVLYRQGFFSEVNQDVCFLRLPRKCSHIGTHTCKPATYTVYYLRVPLHVWKPPHLRKCSVVAFPVSPLKLHTCSEE